MLYDFLVSHSAAIISFVITISGAFVAYLLQPGVKLLWGRANNNFHKVSDSSGTAAIYCEKYFIQNGGRKGAERVEVAFIGNPSGISIYPSRRYSLFVNPEGNTVIELPYISPRELIIVDIININMSPTEIRSVTCLDNSGKQIRFVPQRQFPTAVTMLAALAMLLGVAYVVQVVIAIFLSLLEATQ